MQSVPDRRLPMEIFDKETDDAGSIIDLTKVADLYSGSKASMGNAELLVALYDAHGPSILTPTVWKNLKAMFDSEFLAAGVPNHDFAKDPLFLLARKITPVQDFVIDELMSRLGSEDEFVFESTLIFLYQMFLTGDVSVRGNELDVLYGLLSHGNIKLADIVARILVSSTKYVSSEVSLSFWWTTIRNCAPHRPQIAYKAWIGWVLSESRFTKGEEFKALLKQNEYWRLLREGISIGMKSCERTKYCLQILSASLKELDFDLNLDEMTWRSSETLKYLNSWSRYVALIEILCIDSSLNQAEDSADDIVAFLHPESPIPPIWAVTLFEAGLTSNIQDFVYNLILELGEPLKTFNTSPQFLARKFIPCALQASNFIVVQGTCTYKEKVFAFIQRLCSALGRDEMNVFINELMEEFSESIRQYEAPRVILTNALVTEIKSVLAFDALLSVATYGGCALLGYKSEAMGRLLLANCTNIIIRGADTFCLTVEQALTLVDRLVINGVQTVDLASLAEWMPDAWLPVLKERSSSKPAYAILYALKDSLNFSLPADSVDADKVLLYLHPKLDLSDSPAVTHLAQKLENNTYLTESEFDALSLFPNVRVSVPSSHGDTLVDMLAYLQASNLAAPIPTDVLIDLLVNKADMSGYMTGERRSLHCSSIRHVFDQIQAVPAEQWPLLVDLAKRAFLHDKFEPRLAALKCLSRSMNMLSAEEVDFEDLASALSSIWYAFKEGKLRASEHFVHIAFIKVFTNPKVVLSSGAEDMEAVALDIMDESYARRDLLPPLISGLAQTPCRWVSRVMGAAFCFLQTNMQSFHLESLLAKESGKYHVFWPLSEKSAKALAFNYFSRGHDTAEITSYLLDDPRFSLLQTGKRHDGDEERTRILGFQLLTLMSQFWDEQLGLKIAKTLLEVSVDHEPSPSVRVLVEWIVALVVSKNPLQLVDELVLVPLENNLAPRFISSLGRVGLLVGKEVTKDLKPEFYQKYLDVMIPLSSSNRAAVRHFTVAMIYVIFLDNNLRECVHPLMLKLVDGIAACAESAEIFKGFKSGDDSVWSISKCFTFTGICGGVSNRVTGRFLKDRLYEKDFVEALGPGSYGEDEIDDLRPVTKFHDLTMIRDASQATNENIQTKSGSFDGIQPLQRSELIVVATLCDKPTNLGGICRLCDALGAKLMTMNDISVSKHPQFKNTAVTADKWMPMLQVPENDLLGYLEEKKREGYTLVGIEQTDNSRTLKPDLKFPVKTVLVMGKEREGVPGEVLAHLDFCVEIEQFGVVRSMNIQTATAILVNAYNNQH